MSVLAIAARATCSPRSMEDPAVRYGRRSGSGRMGRPPSVGSRPVKIGEDQNTIFSANCQLRPEGETTLVMVPNAELVGVVFGLPKLVWFQAL